jgi:hypothetical protein
MLALLARTLPENPKCEHELKLDYRLCVSAFLLFPISAFPPPPPPFPLRKRFHSEICQDCRRLSERD